MPDTLPDTTLPIYPGLGQAPNMLACIPVGLIIENKTGSTQHTAATLPEENQTTATTPHTKCRENWWSLDTRFSRYAYGQTHGHVHDITVLPYFD